MNIDPRPATSAEWKDPGTWVPLIVAGLLVWAVSGRSGPAQYFTQGFPILSAVYAIVGMSRCKARSHRLKAVLYGLLLAVAIAQLVRIHWSLVRAREFTLQAANDIRALCLARGKCPERLEGWTWRGPQWRQQSLFEGPLLDWPLRYHSDGETFEVELYICLDTIEVWKGGVDARIVEVH